MPPDEFIVELVDAVEDEIEFPEEDPPEELIEEEVRRLAMIYR